MTWFQALFLGFFQGITEFLPVSSSGHLVIGHKLLGLSRPPVLFDILVHLGTLLAVIVYFAPRLVDFYRRPMNLGKVIIGSIPAGLAGWLLNDQLDLLFNSLQLVGGCLLVTAGFLFSTRLINLAKAKDSLGWLDSFIIGCFQALALFPGISRSGATITAGLWRGMKSETAFVFSFFLGAPAMIGAFLLQLPDLGQPSSQLGLGLLGSLTAGLAGFIALSLLRRVVVKNNLAWFGFYCLFLGVGLLLA